MSSAKQRITDRLIAMSGKYSTYEIFTDWILACSLSIVNSIRWVHDDVWHEREQLYVSTISRYSEKESESFAEMFVWLGDALTDEMSDILGEIYMKANMGSKSAGQFFTPFHLSELCAKISLTGAQPDPDGKYHLLEPSCGGGGMIIAACKTLKDAGLDYQRKVYT